MGARAFHLIKCGKEVALGSRLQSRSWLLSEPQKGGMVNSAFLMTPWWLLSGSAPRPHLQLQARVISSQSRKIWKSLSGYHLGGYHLVPTVSWATSPSVPYLDAGHIPLSLLLRDAMPRRAQAQPCPPSCKGDAQGSACTVPSARRCSAPGNY